MAQTISRSVAVGGIYLLSGQIVTAVAQLVYAGTTGRVLSDEAFGAFTVAISATGLTALLMTTGLVTYALAADDMRPGAVTALHAMSWFIGAATAAIVWVGAPRWVEVWAGSSESITMLRLLCMQVLLSAPGVVMMAMLRREARPKADALTQAVAVLGGLGAGLVAIAWSEESAALVVSPTVTALLTLVIAALARRRRYPLSRPRNIREILGFAWRVSNQNLVFFFLMSLPVWAVSRGASADDLGQFSRALVLTQTPAFALAGAMSRAVQPFYRQVADRTRLRASVQDALSVSSWAVFPAFFLLAAISQRLVDIWLGDGWSLAAELVVPLAVGFGLYVVFSIAANAAQTLGALREVSISQTVMVPTCVIASGVAVYWGSPMIAASAFPATLLSGLFALLVTLGRRELISFGASSRAILSHAGIGAIAAATSFALGQWMGGQTESSIWTVLGAAFGGFLVWGVVAVKTPGGRVLKQRGLLTHGR